MINDTTRAIIERLKQADGRLALIAEPFPDKPEDYRLLADQAILVEYQSHKYSAADDAGPRRVESIEYVLHCLTRSSHRKGEYVTDSLYKLVDDAASQIEGWRDSSDDDRPTFSWVAVAAQNNGELENDEGVFLVTLAIMGGTTRALNIPAI